MNDAEAASERIEALDESGQPFAILTRQQIHEQGLWHRTFQCWYIRVEDGDLRLIFQRRHPEKQANPGKYDATVAGHLLAGEDVTAGVRECYEEMGLAIQFSELHPVDVFRHEQRFGRIVDREICHVFVHRMTASLCDLNPAQDEVTGVYEVRAVDLMGLFTHPGRTIRAQGYSISTTRVPESITLAVENSVERPKVYYDTLLERCTQLFL